MGRAEMLEHALKVETCPRFDMSLMGQQDSQLADHPLLSNSVCDGSWRLYSIQCIQCTITGGSILNNMKICIILHYDLTWLERDASPLDQVSLNLAWKGCGAKSVIGDFFGWSFLLVCRAGRSEASYKHVWVGGKGMKLHAMQCIKGLSTTTLIITHGLSDHIASSVRIEVMWCLEAWCHHHVTWYLMETK